MERVTSGLQQYLASHKLRAIKRAPLFYLARGNTVISLPDKDHFKLISKVEMLRVSLILACRDIGLSEGIRPFDMQLCW
jgi:hypothetical protein